MKHKPPIYSDIRMVATVFLCTTQVVPGGAIALMLVADWIAVNATAEFDFRLP